MPPDETVAETFARGQEVLAQDPAGIRGGSSTVSEVPVETLESPAPPAEIPAVEVDPAIADSASSEGLLSAQTGEAQIAADTQAAETASQRSSVEELMDITAGRSAARATAIEESDAGSEGQRELADLFTGIRAKSARLSQFDDDTFLGEEALRGDSSARDITKATFGAKSRERRLQRAIDRTGAAAELRTDIATAELMQNNITAATAQIDAALEAQYGPVEEALKNEMFFLQRQWQVADRADKQLLEAKQAEVNNELNTIADAKDIANSAMQTGVSTASEVQQLGDPNTTPEEKSRISMKILARGAKEDRDLANRLKRQQIALNSQKLSVSGSPTSGVSPVTGKPYTDSQYNAGIFASRMNQAEDELAGGRGAFIPGLPGFAKSSDRKLFEQAERNFITAILRRESGAAIGEDEFAQAREVYIPQSSDPQSVLDEKTEARRRARIGIIGASAGSYQEIEDQAAFERVLSDDSEEWSEFEDIFNSSEAEIPTDFNPELYY